MYHLKLSLRSGCCGVCSAAVPTHLPSCSRFAIAFYCCNPPSLPNNWCTPTSKIWSTTKKNTPKRKTAIDDHGRRHLNFFARRRNHLAHLRAHVAQKAGEVGP